MGEYGLLTQSTNVPNPRTRYKRLKNILAVILHVLSCAHVCAQLLQPLARYLIGSPGILQTTHILIEILRSVTVDPCSTYQIINMHLLHSHAGRRTKFAPVNTFNFQISKVLIQNFQI